MVPTLKPVSANEKPASAAGGAAGADACAAGEFELEFVAAAHGAPPVGAAAGRSHGGSEPELALAAAGAARVLDAGAEEAEAVDDFATLADDVGEELVAAAAAGAGCGFGSAAVGTANESPNEKVDAAEPNENPALPSPKTLVPAPVPSAEAPVSDAFCSFGELSLSGDAGASAARVCLVFERKMLLRRTGAAARERYT